MNGDRQVRQRVMRILCHVAQHPAGSELAQAGDRAGVLLGTERVPDLGVRHGAPSMRYAVCARPVVGMRLSVKHISRPLDTPTMDTLPVPNAAGQRDMTAHAWSSDANESMPSNSRSSRMLPGSADSNVM